MAADWQAESRRPESRPRIRSKRRKKKRGEKMASSSVSEDLLHDFSLDGKGALVVGAERRWAVQRRSRWPKRARRLMLASQEPGHRKATQGSRQAGAGCRSQAGDSSAERGDSRGPVGDRGSRGEKNSADCTSWSMRSTRPRSDRRNPTTTALSIKLSRTI